MKTSTKRKAIMKEAGIPPKKRGRPVGSKKMDKLDKINSKIRKNAHELLALYPVKEYLEDQVVSKTKKDKAWEDFMIPTPKELGMDGWFHSFKVKNKKQSESATMSNIAGWDKRIGLITPMSLPDKITLVLTLVNVAILISLVISNV